MRIECKDPSNTNPGDELRDNLAGPISEIIHTRRVGKKGKDQ